MKNIHRSGTNARHQDTKNLFPNGQRNRPTRTPLHNAPCHNPKQTESTSTTRITIAIPGTNQIFTLRIPSRCKCIYRNPPKPEDEITKLPLPPTPILKKSKPTPEAPINADDIVCIEDKMLWLLKPEEPSADTSSPPPTKILTNNNDTTDGRTPLPQDLDAIKDFIQHDKENGYILLK